MPTAEPAWASTSAPSACCWSMAAPPGWARHWPTRACAPWCPSPRAAPHAERLPGHESVDGAGLTDAIGGRHGDRTHTKHGDARLAGPQNTAELLHPSHGLLPRFNDSKVLH